MQQGLIHNPEPLCPVSNLSAQQPTLSTLKTQRRVQGCVERQWHCGLHLWCRDPDCGNSKTEERLTVASPDVLLNWTVLSSVNGPVHVVDWATTELYETIIHLQHILSVLWKLFSLKDFIWYPINWTANWIEKEQEKKKKKNAIFCERILKWQLYEYYLLVYLVPMPWVRHTELCVLTNCWVNVNFMHRLIFAIIVVFLFLLFSLHITIHLQHTQTYHLFHCPSPWPQLN